jgi:hypothetical protein
VTTVDGMIGFEVVESDFDVSPTYEMVSLYHSLIGSIGYVVNTVSFDVSYGLSVLTRFLVKTNDKFIHVAQRVIKYLVKTKDLGITWKITPGDRKAGFGGRDIWRGRRLVYNGPCHSEESRRVCYFQ